MKSNFIILSLIVCLLLVLLPTLPATAQSENEQIEKYLPYINEAAQKYNVCPELIEAMIIVESNGEPNVVSSCGAVGLMQVIPKYNYERLSRLHEGSNSLYDPRNNIMVGTDLLMYYASKYDDVYLALAAYNMGDNSKGFKQVLNGSRCSYSEKVLNLSERLERNHGK